MKGLLLVSLLITCIAANASDSPQMDPAVSLLSANPADLVLAFSAHSLETSTVEVDGQVYSDFVMPGEGFSVEEGLPALPAVTRVLLVPPEGSITVEVLRDESEETAANRFPKPFYDQIDGQADFSLPQATYLNLEGVYPRDLVSVGHSETYRGVRLIPITIHPVQFNRAQGTYVIHRNLEVAVRVKQNDGSTFAGVDELLPVNITKV